MRNQTSYTVAGHKEATGTVTCSAGCCKWASVHGHHRIMHAMDVMNCIQSELQNSHESCPMIFESQATHCIAGVLLKHSMQVLCMDPQDLALVQGSPHQPQAHP